MDTPATRLDRRLFLASSVAASGALMHSAVAQSDAGSRYEFCAFIKFLQSLSYDELAETIAELGFSGIEATVRRNGQVLPQRVEEDLPKLVEALQKCGLRIAVMASDVNQVDPLSERVLTTAAKLGVKKYRMANYRYDHRQPVFKQLDQLRPVMKDLVDLGRELGISAVYQNHSGARNVGALLFDLHSLIRDYPVSDIGVAFDIRHATVEGGLAWPTHFNLMRSHLGAIYVKDFRWDGRRPTNVPLGTGQVDRAFFKSLNESDYRGTISLHVEYLREAGTAANIKALRTDFKTLRSLLGTS